MTSPASRWHRIIKLLLLDKIRAVVALLLLLAQGVAAAVAPRVLGYAVDVASTKGLAVLVLIGGGYLAVELIRIVSARLQAVEFSHIGQGAVHRLRIEAFHHVLSLPWRTVRALGPSDLLSRLTVDIRSASALFEACFLRIIERICAVAAIFVGIISLSVPVGLSVIALFPLLLLGAWYTSQRLYAAFYARQAAISAVTTSLADSIELIAETKLLGLSAKRIDQFCGESSRLAAVQKVPPLLFGQLHAAMSILSAIAVATTLLLGERYIAAGLLTKGELVTLNAYIGSIMWPIIIIIDQWSVLLQGLASVDRIYELLEIPTEDAAVVESSEQPQSPPEAGDPLAAISLTRVSFQYPETKRGVIDLSLIIRRGERVGIVGATGSGKSTISRLILGLVSPDRGAISIGGAPIASIPREKLRRMIAFMPQHPEMFIGTPLENITLWDTQPDRFTKKITSLPESVVDLCTTDNDAATGLSVGEQQCVAALRVLMREPEIIVLDEPTAAVDPILEQWLMNTIFTSDAIPTAVIIAHRLSTLERCDRIMMMEEGRVVDEGRHEELMQRSASYRQVVEAEARR